MVGGRYAFPNLTRMFSRRHWSSSFLRRVDEESYRAACEEGEQFILGQQVSFGLWHFDDRKSHALNILVMDVLEKLLPPIPQQERLLELSRELFFKAEELARSGEHVDAQIAVMVAHHAVEMFHYGLFSSMDPAEVFVKSDGKTIGVREALGILQRRLQADANLAVKAGLPFRNDIQLLANARDAIVHQGQTVSGENSTYHVRQARRFLEELSSLVLGGNLLA